MTATHLEVAVLLLATQIAVGHPSDDLPEHTKARQMASRHRSGCLIHRGGGTQIDWSDATTSVTRAGRNNATPHRVLPTLDVWQEHPAARRAFRFLRLVRDEVRRMARLPVLHIYTDGFYTDDVAGVAFIVLGPSERIGALERYQVENVTSAYCMEIIVVIKALRYVKNKCSASTARLYTECLYLLGGISKHRTTDTRVRYV
ncbi:hypothetical protein MRX96_051337 [Rhipicephalus microplus]